MRRYWCGAALGVLGVAAAIAGQPTHQSPNQIELCQIDPQHCDHEQEDPGYGVSEGQGSQSAVTIDTLERAIVRLQRRVDALETQGARDGGQRQ